jgi:hypothetical protein
MAPTSSNVDFAIAGANSGPHQYSLNGGAGAAINDKVTYFASISFN